MNSAGGQWLQGMEEIHLPISGCFVAETIIKKDDGDEGEDSEEEEDDIQWLAYNEVTDSNSGKSFVQYSRPKQSVGSLVNLQTGRSQNVRGSFHLHDQWWQISIHRTRTSKDKKKFPKDQYAVWYRLRDDPKTHDHQVVHLFLKKLQDLIEFKQRDPKNKEANEDRDPSAAYIAGQEMFYRYLKERDQYADLDFDNLGDRVHEFYDSFTDETRDGCVREFETAVLNMSEYRLIQRAQSHPDLFRYLPQLFPGHFRKLVLLDMAKLGKLTVTVEQEPGLLAFKPIVARKCNVLGCETNSTALRLSGLMAKVPVTQQDAMAIYEFLKDQTKRHGHTYIYYDRILDDLGQELTNIEDAYEFLEKNLVTKTKVEGGQRKVFLMSLWRAENEIASGLHSLMERHDKQPWILDIDWEKEDFTTIREDPDQWRAAQLISNNAVVAISGKGGCGKTHVVTKVITAAQASRKKATSANDNENEQAAMDAETQAFDEDEEEDLFNNGLEEEDSCPDTIQLLLTAPTGKAANLLGKRANSPSYTLHQVIFSYRKAVELGIDWKHENTTVLVVDECSLVAVSTFAFLIELLLENANLKRVVLLGDIRQLPSIEPGNFLEDAFKSMELLRCGVELRKNHRAESQIVIENAIRISKRMYPQFHREKFTFRRVLDGNPAVTGNDYTVQDTIEEVHRLLAHDALQSDISSQFISFTNNICETINDICCKKYSGHRIMDERRKEVFRVNDKICCTRNSNIDVYEDFHGVMEVKTKTVVVDDKAKKEPDQKRLCNGEIFWIERDLEQVDNMNRNRNFIWLSDRSESQPVEFCVDKRQLRRECKVKHAWARTIHTFQGSETDVIVYIVGPPNKHQNWQHVYTAITRGKKAVFIVGQESVLRDVVKRPERKRQTSLRKQLTEMIQKTKNLLVSSQNGTIATQARTTATQFGRNMQSPSKPVISQYPPTQPVKFGTDHNTTSVVRSVLSSLASEHVKDDVNIEDYSSDDEESQSLFTSIKPRQVKPAGKGLVKMESGDIDSDSDDSQSLLAKPATEPDRNITRLPTCITRDSHAKARTHSQQTLQSGLQPDNVCKLARQSRDMDSDSTDPDSDDSQSLLSTPSPMDVKSVHRHNSKSTCQPGNSIEHNSDFPNPNRNTVITKNSNLFTVSDFAVRGHNLHKSTPGSYASPGSSTDTSPNDIGGPRSNESQWSEGIDDSAYLQAMDGNLSYQSPANETSNVPTICPSFPPVNATTVRETERFVKLKRSLSNNFGGISPFVNESILNNSRTSRMADISTDSQWSEVDDNEQYLTLDLEDIMEMEHNIPGGNVQQNIPNREQDSFKTHRSPVSIPDNENEIMNNMPQRIVPDTPPTPKLPHTPPNSSEKSGVSADLLSPGCKRQLTMDSQWESKRSRSDAQPNAISPIKRSLAKLDFS